jgi:hypothetical protein
MKSPVQPNLLYDNVLYNGACVHHGQQLIHSAVNGACWRLWCPVSCSHPARGFRARIRPGS